MGMLTGIECGTTALDCKIKGNFTHDPFMGSLALVDQANLIGNSKVFQIPSIDILKTGDCGGTGNSVKAIATILKTETGIGQTEAPFHHIVWGIMALLGDDDVGQIWLDKIDPLINRDLVECLPTMPSGLSVVRIQKEEYATETVPKGERAIYFRAGASGSTVFTKERLQRISERNPFNINISYPGLFPYGADKTNGQNLAWFVQKAQGTCPCLTIDTHGFTKLRHIEPVLSYIDMFNSNFADAVRIFLNKSVTEHIADFEKMTLYQELAENITGKYFDSETKSTRSRMFTITDKRGAFLIFQNPQYKQIVVDYLDSPCALIPAVDKTGAGDVRFALQRLFIAARLNDEWSNGNFSFGDAITAVNVGQIGTTLHIQGKEAKALEGISISALEKVAVSGTQFGTIHSLKEELRR